MQTDQLGGMHRGECFRHLSLADAGFAFEQQRPLEKFHKPKCRRDVAVGYVADGGQSVRDIVADSIAFMHVHCQAQCGIQ